MATDQSCCPVESPKMAGVATASVSLTLRLEPYIEKEVRSPGQAPAGACKNQAQRATALDTARHIHWQRGWGRRILVAALSVLWVKLKRAQRLVYKSSGALQHDMLSSNKWALVWSRV